MLMSGAWKCKNQVLFDVRKRLACEVRQRGDRMSDIKFYIPQDESIPTDLRLYVGENYVEYERTANGFLFKTLIDDEDEAMKVVEQIVNKMKSEHDESEHGVSWRTISLAVVPQNEKYKIGTQVEWKYRIRDSY